MDELCKGVFSDQTDPPLPDSSYILATLRSDQIVGLKSVLLHVRFRSLAVRFFIHFVYLLHLTCSMDYGLWVVSYLWNRELVLGLLDRLLRQKLLHLQLTSPKKSPPPQLCMQLVEWLPATSESLIVFIVSAYSYAVVLGELQMYQLVQ